MLLPITQGIHVNKLHQQQLKIEPFADKSFEFLHLHMKSHTKCEQYMPATHLKFSAFVLGA